jgi:hypothetical protein
MTEAEWLSCREPWAMRNFVVIEHQPISGRKQRLYCCATCRRLLDIWGTGGQRWKRVLGLAERYAEGTATDDELSAANEAALHDMQPGPHTKTGREVAAARAFYCLTLNDVAEAFTADNEAGNAIAYVRSPYSVNVYEDGFQTSYAQALQAFTDKDEAAWCEAKDAEMATQAGIFREVIGNPFRTVAIDPSLRSTAVMSLALTAYTERSLPSGHLAPARLAVLSDALEEVGCADAALLSHLRSPGPHVRGCWALDLVLGKD